MSLVYYDYFDVMYTFFGFGNTKTKNCIVICKHVNVSKPKNKQDKIKSEIIVK